MKPLPVAKLGSLTTLISSGSTPLGGASRYLSEGPVMFIRSQNVRMNWLDLSDVVYIDSDLHGEMKRTHVRSGDVLINITGASIGRVAAFDRNGTTANVNQHVCIIRPKSQELDFRYLTTLLCSPGFQENINRLQRGGTRQALTFDMIAGFDIPLLPLQEQRRIAAILDKADAIRRKREDGICLTEELLRSTFLEMFGDPVKNERGWGVVQVKQAGHVQLGRQRAPKYQTGKHTHPYIRVANVFEDRIDLSDLLSMDFDSSDFATYRLVHGDILLNEGQSTELVGRPAMWRDELPECCFQNTLIRFRADPKKMEPEFALEVFLYCLRTGQFARLSSKTSSVAHLGAARFAEMPVPLPPLKLQSLFAERRRQIHKLHEARQCQVRESNELFGSLVQRAFRGEL